MNVALHIDQTSRWTSSDILLCLLYAAKPFLSNSDCDHDKGTPSARAPPPSPVLSASMPAASKDGDLNTATMTAEQTALKDEFYYWPGNACFLVSPIPVHSTRLTWVYRFKVFSSECHDSRLFWGPNTSQRSIASAATPMVLSRLFTCSLSRQPISASSSASCFLCTFLAQRP